jgi:L-alanine-DL-glutamate epimerase-like enolase superfamily enzyme
MRDEQIDRAEVFVVGPDVERFTWAEGMSDQYMVNIILRLTTKSGLEGVSGAAMINSHGFDHSVGETLRYLLPDILGQTPAEREGLWHRMRNLGTPQVPQAQSLIDIALWDMSARFARLPLYQLLGGARHKILSYASTPLLANERAYIDYITLRQREGFKAVKFHCWCNPARDLPLCEAAAEHFAGSGIALMLDVEQRYDLAGALKVGKRIAELGFRWFEAPLVDTDVEGYRELRRHAGVPIIAAGNTWLDLQQIGLAIRSGLWSAVRVDATICGGITPIRKIMALAEAHGMTVEIQCWGYTLTQAANLHVMLAYPNCQYFEQPVPYNSFEYGATDVIRTDSEGYVHAPRGPGLGIGLDWKAIERAALLKYQVTSAAGASD